MEQEVSHHHWRFHCAGQEEISGIEKEFQKKAKRREGWSHAVRPPRTCRANSPGILKTEIRVTDWTGIPRSFL
jgi:hypothetical protein